MVPFRESAKRIVDIMIQLLNPSDQVLYDSVTINVSQVSDTYNIIVVTLRWTGLDSLVGSMSASDAIGHKINFCIRHILLWRIFALPLCHEEQVISYWQKNRC